MSMEEGQGQFWLDFQEALELSSKTTWWTTPETHKNC